MSMPVSKVEELFQRPNVRIAVVELARLASVENFQHMFLIIQLTQSLNKNPPQIQGESGYRDSLDV
jgi:hypothetical protein